MARDHVRHNRKFWDADADAYQDAHGDELASRPAAWGVWRIPEAEVQAIGPVDGLDVLEFGCGAAQWSVALACQGARATGLDFSSSQLRHAREYCTRAAADVRLVQASGEVTPFRARSFDVVFCDHGAMSFCDPRRTVPEVARLLRPGGVLAFCITDPLVYLTWNEEKERQSRRLQRDYDSLGAMHLGGEGTIDWVIPPSEWIALFTKHDLAVEQLHELRAPHDATTTYTDFVPYKWARRWPAEQLWRVRKR